LALLALEAERASTAGHDDVGVALREQVDRMRRQIDYHLAHARAAASGTALGARASVAESADGLARTLPRLYADRPLSIDVHVDPTHAVRVQREDLDEMLGNLLDNACKWARSRVVIESAQAGEALKITVDDDGPGLAAELRDKVLLRGVRADEKAAGFRAWPGDRARPGGGLPGCDYAGGVAARRPCGRHSHFPALTDVCAVGVVL
jgi:signal transduction histidine kinase